MAVWKKKKKKDKLLNIHTQLFHLLVSFCCFFFLLLAGLRKIAKNWEVLVKGMIIVKVYLQIQCTVVSGVPRIYGLTHCCGQIIECLVV